jgi:hypothetical protein
MHHTLAVVLASYALSPPHNATTTHLHCALVLVQLQERIVELLQDGRLLLAQGLEPPLHFCLTQLCLVDVRMQ